MDDLPSKHGEFILYGARGGGSAIAECMLVRSTHYQFVDLPGFDEPGATREQLLAINPLGQIPVLILPDQRVVTETAAMALVLSEWFPDAQLAPSTGDPDRVMFLRLLIWLVANVYPTFTYGDYPGRWVDEDTGSLRRSTDEYRQRLWLEFLQLAPMGRWILGDRFSALDLYVAVMTHWRPRTPWFREHCPQLSAIADRIAEHPVYRAVMAENFPADPT